MQHLKKTNIKHKGGVLEDGLADLARLNNEFTIEKIMKTNNKKVSIKIMN